MIIGSKNNRAVKEFIFFVNNGLRISISDTSYKYILFPLNCNYILEK